MKRPTRSICRQAEDRCLTRTALLFPVYHENPARIAGTIAAMAGELAEMGNRRLQFSVFIVSDTRGEKDGAEEEAAYRELKQRLAGTISLLPPPPREPGRKAGNIKDWVERFGGGYQSFIILDADSMMAGETSSASLSQWNGIRSPD